mmetsp:Transcript_41609/g.68735  ORF Transcript_41609/g.68735 Transcript_41609/m.68735 type:complete len:127 (+) Transcript_41609:247-627(+)
MPDFTIDEGGIKEDYLFMLKRKVSAHALSILVVIFATSGRLKPHQTIKMELEEHPRVRTVRSGLKAAFASGVPTTCAFPGFVMKMVLLLILILAPVSHSDLFRRRFLKKQLPDRVVHGSASILKLT